MRVITLHIVNLMTIEMYEGKKSEKKMSIFDEVAFMLGSSKILAKVIENGYRRARKYNGSFGTIFQSILDTKNFGTVGSVMLNNAAFRFFLESNDYTQAINEKILSYQGLEQELLLSLKSNRPHYSDYCWRVFGWTLVLELLG
jgi:conjugal transfer ATP-binding protein TraC